MWSKQLVLICYIGYLKCQYKFIKRNEFSYVISVFFLLCFHARLFIYALWSPAEKGLTSWLTFVMYNCEVVRIGA